MWWSCFSWDLKGPYHIWEKETAAQKDEANDVLEAINKELEPLKRAEWLISKGLDRTHLDHNVPGRKPGWQWTAKNGKIVRSAKNGGIDWWRYQNEVLKPKLVPFAQQLERFLNNEPEPSTPFAQAFELNASPSEPSGEARVGTNRSKNKGKGRERPREEIPITIDKTHPLVRASMATIENPDNAPPAHRIRALVQEDKATAHNHWLQQHIFDINNVLRLLWPGK